MFLSEAAAYARAIAPQVDRLAICVHRYARQKVGPVFRRFGLERAGILIDARAILLGGPITLDDLVAVARYAPRPGLVEALDAHVRERLLGVNERDAQRLYMTTERGREFLIQLTALQGEAITALWAANAADLPDLCALLSSVTSEAAIHLSRDHYPAFHGQHEAPDPPDATPAHLVLTRLTTLRYLRADAHAGAWAAHRLDAAGISALTALWRGGQEAALPEGAPDSLCLRGWAAYDDAAWRITNVGRAVREAIEVETDEGAAPPWSVLDPDQRAWVLRALERLPD